MFVKIGKVVLNTTSIQHVECREDKFVIYFRNNRLNLEISDDNFLKKYDFLLSQLECIEYIDDIKCVANGERYSLRIDHIKHFTCKATQILIKTFNEIDLKISIKDNPNLYKDLTDLIPEKEII